MKPTRTWTWRFGVLGVLALTTVIGTLVATGKLHWWNLRGAADVFDSNDSVDMAVQAMLTDAEATRVSELVKQMMNPASALEATAQLRDHIEGLVNQQSPAAAPSMAWYLECLVPRFANLDTETRRINIALMSEVFGWFGQNSTTCWTALLSPSKGILGAAMSDPSSDVTLAAIQFARACWEWAPPDVVEPAKRRALGTWKAELHNQCVECATSATEMGPKGKRMREERVRAAAGVAVVTVPIDTAAARGLVLLRDGSPTVRRAVLVALSERQELLSSEDVVGFLRDPSPAVRTGADIVLASRGLTPEQIALAKRATDPSPLVRAQAPRHIVESTAVDRVVWLTHLSRDIIASVRSEAARALATVGEEDCTTRLTEMADADPDQDVRKLARDLLRNGTTSARANPNTEILPALQSPKAN